jgi:hypothetical protein
LNTPQAFDSRVLKFRKHFQVYFVFLIIVNFLLFILWTLRFWTWGYEQAIYQNRLEFMLSILFVLSSPILYFLWLHPRIQNEVHLFFDRLVIKNQQFETTLNFSEIVRINVYFGSLFSLSLKNGKNYFFNSDLERLDYIWEALNLARQDLIPSDLYSKFQITLVKSDHHQKRKEWFLKHRAVDVICWVIIPLGFMVVSYLIQSKEIYIFHLGIYFFRLFMYSLLTMLVISISYTFLLKKLIFDKKFDFFLDEKHVLEKHEKIRDLDYEDLIIKKSKIFQAIIASFVFALIIKTDINFYSIAKAKSHVSGLKIPSGKALIVDNRFNCFDCKYYLNEGDVIIFGSGVFGQVIAKAGETVGEVVQDSRGRTIASVSQNEVPDNHLAVKSANGKDILFIEPKDIIGKLKK